MEKELEATPGKGDDGRQGLYDEVADGGVFVQVGEKPADVVANEDFVAGAILVALFT